MGWLLDVVILAIIAVAAFLGWKKGFIKTAADSASGLISLVVAFLLCRPLSLLMEWTELPVILNIAISFVVLYFITKLVLFFSSEALTKLFDVPVLRTVNQGLGIALSVAISLLKVIAFCFVVNAVFDAAAFFELNIFESFDRDQTILFALFSKLDILSLLFSNI